MLCSIKKSTRNITVRQRSRRKHGEKKNPRRWPCEQDLLNRDSKGGHAVVVSASSNTFVWCHLLSQLALPFFYTLVRNSLHQSRTGQGNLVNRIRQLRSFDGLEWMCRIQGSRCFNKKAGGPP